MTTTPASTAVATRPDRIELSPDHHLLVLTGAGISAESGIPTYRGLNGLWNVGRQLLLATPAGYAKHTKAAWQMFGKSRRVAGKAQPNAAHRALAALEAQMGERMLVVTQNVDGLHWRAGTERLIELHGSLWQVRCSGCDREPWGDGEDWPKAVVACDRCGAPLRPHVVMFGEQIDPLYIRAIRGFLAIAVASDAPLACLVVGTSGVVFPANQLAEWVHSLGGTTYLVNRDEPDNVQDFDHAWYGSAVELLPGLLGV